MRPSSGPQFALWPRGQRWLLVVLTLIASAAHLARSPQAGGLGLPGTWVLSGTPSDGHGERPDDRAGMDMPDMAMSSPDAGAHAHAYADAAPAPTPGLSDAAPNAPPHHSHTSDAHCPFCLTAGFALEAQPAIFIFGPAARALWAAPVCLEPLLAPVRHADARAPPCPHR